MKLFDNRDRDPEAIVQRVGSIVARHPGHNIHSVAEAIGVPSADLEALLEKRARIVDIGFLIDVIAALVSEIGIDPHWLLTAECNPAMHREALLLGEDRTAKVRRALRRWIHRQYVSVHPRWFNWPSRWFVRQHGLSRI